MAILDELLGIGGSDSASMTESKNDSSIDFGPAVGPTTGKILDFSTSDDDGGDGGSSTQLTGIDGLGLGIAAPLNLSNSSWSSSSEQSDSDGGGLLGGLL